MAFDQSSISSEPPAYRGNQAYLSWTGTLPAGGWYQVYVGGVLAWTGRQTRCSVPVPSGPTSIAIGTVAAGERDTDFSADLPTPPARRAVLAWTGDASTASYRVYAATSPGGAVSFASPVATVAGEGAGSYSWTSGPLAYGTWSFAVVPVDSSGAEGPAQYCSATVDAPPRAPAAFAGSTQRLRYTLSGSPPTATLSWNAPPA